MLPSDLSEGAVIGVDTHKDTHTAAVLSRTGVVIESLTVTADPAGYRQLIAFGDRHQAHLWAIEGTGSYGAGLTAALADAGQRVVEIDRPHRPARRGGAKSDDIDAVLAARQALAGVGLAEPRGRGDREAIRVLLTTRAQAVEFRSRAVSALHALVTSAPDSIRQRLRALSSGQLLARCVAMRGSARHSSEEAATVTALRATASRALACETEAADLEAKLKDLVQRAAPGLLELPGVGTIVAAQLLVSWSHPGRVRSEAAFAKLAGAAPIEASSGTVSRHRLNRSGDRQLNRALHIIALVRMRQDPETKAYVQRRLAEGKSRREIRRCLKRYIARQIFRYLEALPAPCGT